MYLNFPTTFMQILNRFRKKTYMGIHIGSGLRVSLGLYVGTDTVGIILVVECLGYCSLVYITFGVL